MIYNQISQSLSRTLIETSRSPYWALECLPAQCGHDIPAPPFSHVELEIQMFRPFLKTYRPGSHSEFMNRLRHLH